MSVNRPSRPADHDSSASNYPSEPPLPFGQDPIDHRLKRLRDEVLPIYPFLLTVPSDVPFRLGNRFVNNWAVSDDGPFTPEEHQLQYMTFLAHDEGDSLLVAVGDWSDGNGSVMPDQRSAPQSAASTPSSGSLKKKISLNDYKNKRKSGTSASPAGQEVAGQGSSTNSGFDDNQPASKANLTKEPSSKPRGNSTSQHSSDRLERKRPPQQDRGPFTLHEKEQPSKKPRLSAEPPTESDRRERSKPHKLPALLSPTLPPTSRSPRLPRLLSPTLPPDLERELAKLDEESHITEPAQRNKQNADATKLKTQKPRSSDKGPSQLDPGTSRPNLPVPGKRPSSANHKPSATLDASYSDSCETVKTDPVLQKTEKSGRLIVRLKYGRSNRKRVEALLKFSGKMKTASKSPVNDLADPGNSHSSKDERSTGKVHSSRPLGADGRVKNSIEPNKERSTNSKTASSDKPGTPGLSITPHPQEKSKPSSTVPSKGRRESNHRGETVAEAPVKPNSRHSSGDSTTAARQSPLPPNNQPSARSGERRAWKDEYQKYGNLGRELKHAAERHTARDNVSTADEKLAAATAIEAILCFILAFAADDKSKEVARQTGDSSSWLSILAYWRVVKKNSAPFPRLYSLCLILGAVSYETIHTLDLERLAVIPLPGEQTSPPTPGSDGNSASSESRRNRKDLADLKKRLPECYKESQRLWLEGSRGLNEDVLEREFPRTWSRRSKNFSDQGKQPLKAGDYSGDYFLPLGRTTSPVETVRFGYTMLKEWCANEGVDWRGRLSL
ncbi:predicted protein [Aspergillus terreus NIH2624]|uniref:Ell binding protein Ebp1 C-terminal domain-containing protein n=1 Tax=Aspergillus terreus (strain NIH 2624 / FGSC A1156) TaxID=341663 RepID=Q0C7W6_ASPTN|nr:uncharacterized protein ATEG_10218 [Aspergillus terreus NIH2624]EAU29667.1 predicted protein [Aspergillus terreus NIH2624]